MSREITIVTPENIPLTLELAGIGSRFGAILVDSLVIASAIIVISIVWAILVALLAATVPELNSISSAIYLVVIFLIFFGYSILFETIWNGQTPGKRTFSLRVVRDGGYPVTFFAVATRNLIRIADFLPAAYGAGALCIFFNPEYKRLGDLAAGTIVIKERKVAPLPRVAIAGLQSLANATLPPTVNNHLDVLTESELELLRRYAVRRWQMTGDDAERMAYRIIVPLIARLNLTFVQGAPPRYADLASTLMAVADRTASQRDALPSMSSMSSQVSSSFALRAELGSASPRIAPPAPTQTAPPVAREVFTVPSLAPDPNAPRPSFPSFVPPPPAPPPLEPLAPLPTDPTPKGPTTPPEAR